MRQIFNFKCLILLVFIDCLEGRFLLIKLNNEDEIHSRRLRLRNKSDGKLQDYDGHIDIYI